ncbi:MAG TPA: hypothetical protein VGV37_06090 [Aliidongia sp.]|uniref:hypothetical protein n=1 Tax=Aliidongia sp. TaxID=1914230 RepID=UPI002DDD369B|nr:hypothetical protein [Aliidongia sp.]HEV2674094.1 hypothetical protein [Aliidongia sp.]
MQKILRGFGAGSFGLMEDFHQGDLTVQFEWHQRRVTIKANAKGYAAAWLREHPWSHRSRSSRIEHERKALSVGNIAVYSILRDWIKGQVTAVEIGMLTFEGAFLGQIMLPNGQTVLERISATDMLPAIAGPRADGEDGKDGA